jgi:CheY-like chemotaxis protein
MVRLLAKECLEEAGMKVTEAADGLQAVESYLRDLPTSQPCKRGKLSWNISLITTN